MKYKDRDELVSGLRKLADFIEVKGHMFPVEDLTVEVNEYVHEDGDWSDKPVTKRRTAKQKMAALARVLGSAEKIHDSYYFTLCKTFGPVELKFQTGRSEVCQKVVKSTKIIPAHVQPARQVPARVEEEVEWICDEPLLAS